MVKTLAQMVGEDVRGRFDNYKNINAEFELKENGFSISFGKIKYKFIFNGDKILEEISDPLNHEKLLEYIDTHIRDDKVFDSHELMKKQWLHKVKVKDKDGNEKFEKRIDIENISLEDCRITYIIRHMSKYHESQKTAIYDYIIRVALFYLQHKNKHKD